MNEHVPLTTLPLMPGSRPFALSEEERKLNGDWWAWQFLRRNPFYRRDYILRHVRPDVQKWRANSSLMSLLGQPPKPVSDDIDLLDARYFCSHGRILSGPLEWPEVDVYSFRKYCSEHSELNLHDVFLRDFDCATTYGIADWFDPDISTLPTLEDGQSWFYLLTEPLWDVGDPGWTMKSSVYEHPQFGRVSVGLDVDNPIYYRELKYYKPESIVSPEGKIGYRNVSINKPVRRACFSSDSEMYFAVSLDRSINMQLQPLKILATSFQKQLLSKGILVKVLAQPIGRQPMIFHPEQGPAQTIGFLQDLLTRAPERLHHVPKQHWRAVLIDTQFPLVAQFKHVEKELKSQQNALDEKNQLPFEHPQRIRNADAQEFWLKKALCMLELQQGLPGAKKTTPAGAKLIAQAIFDPSHSQHKRIRPNSGIKKTDSLVHQGTAQNPKDFFLWDSETYKDSLKESKKLSMGKYQVLVGISAEDMYKKDSDD